MNAVASKSGIRRVGVVCGMIAEGECLRDAVNARPTAERPAVIAVGGRSADARAAAERYVKQGFGGLVSFGVAGGLDPRLKPGDLVIGTKVIGPDGDVYVTHEPWRNRLLAACEKAKLPRVFEGACAGRGEPAKSASEKKLILDSTGALAVDMESHEVADVARTAGLPFVVVRAVLDSASHAIPSSALAGLAADGSTRPGAVLGHAALRPWEMAGLARLARDQKKALAALRAIAALGFFRLFADI
ncbi:MAG: hypothetical protein AB7G15_09380 [Alphaproteobacteria bacterium]